MNHWLVKQEPEEYSWTRLLKDRCAAWTGVRNFQARNHLRSMEAGDLVLFYHSGKEKRFVGVARVAKGPYPDPTAKEGDWSAVDLKAVAELRAPVELQAVRADSRLQRVPLLRQSRLSVIPLAASESGRILELGGTEL